MAPELPQRQPRSAEESDRTNGDPADGDQQVTEIAGAQRSDSNEASTATVSPDADGTNGTTPDQSVEGLIEGMIASQTADLEAELDQLEAQVEELENFARLSLDERKIQQTEANLSEFSDSMSSFAEKAFNNINALEARVDLHALVLSAILDGLDDADVDVDLTEVYRQQEDRLVLEDTPEEQLEQTIGSQ